MSGTLRMTFIVRPTEIAEASLLPAIERSAAQAFLSMPGLEWIAEDQVCSAESHRLFIASGTSWVALDEAGAIDGFLIAARCDDELHINEIAVRREAQGKGRGNVLMAAVITWARAQNFRALTLTTFIDVPWNAPFYGRLGFQRVEAGNDPRLDGLLQQEIARGLPAARRCAMRLTVYSQ